MTPEERAEKIINKWLDGEYGYVKSKDEDYLDFNVSKIHLIQLIKEAQQEAVEMTLAFVENSIFVSQALLKKEIKKLTPEKVLGK